MGWSISWDNRWKRDIGYGVPAYCDHPGCKKKIDRGLSYVCGDEPYGGEHGCGLYFCEKHMGYGNADPDDEDSDYVQMCERCKENKEWFDAKPDHKQWIRWKLKDKSWEKWRKENPEEVERLSSLINQ